MFRSGDLARKTLQEDSKIDECLYQFSKQVIPSRPMFRSRTHHGDAGHCNAISDLIIGYP
jgi:hypothetical protein